MYALILDYNCIAALPQFTYMQDLTYLHLSNNSITDVTPLAGISRRLHSLHLHNNNITDIAPLEGLDPFELTLAGNPVADSTPITFADPVFEQLLRTAMDRPAGTICAQELSTYTELWIQGEQISLSPGDAITGYYGNESGTPEIQSLQDLTHFTSLQRLVIRGHAFDDLSPLAALTSLTHLDLAYGDGSLSTCDLTPLTALPFLATLDLTSNGIARLSLSGPLPALHTLNLRRNAISDITPLSQLTALQRLDLSENAITDLTPLGNLTALTELRLAHNAIMDITPLASLTSLTTLWLNDNAIVDIRPLAGNEYYDLQIEGNDIAN